MVRASAAHIALAHFRVRHSHFLVHSRFVWAILHRRHGGRLSKVLAGTASLTRSASAAQVSKSGWGDWRQQRQHK
jgi:hypothetical protein